MLGGLGLAGLVAHADARKNRKKKRAKAGQATGKKRKRCCRGLVKDGSGRCARPPCTPASCPANYLCHGGVCRPCDVICPSGNAAICGATLQAAMDEGGTVYVCPGRYQGGFVLTTAARVIGAGQGAAAASNTVLDGNGAERVLLINEGVGTVALERLRLTDGHTSSSGAGIHHGGSTLRLTECTVSGNTSEFGGGGIRAERDQTLELTRCTVRGNKAIGGSGGGIFTRGTTTLTDCLVANNEASYSGGGLLLDAGTTSLFGTTQVRGNGAPYGGGIRFGPGTLVVAGTCRVTQNTAAAGNGGGIINWEDEGAATLQGADPSPIVVNNCHDNCAGAVPKCAATPVSCS